MKKLFSFFILACITTGTFCQTLFTYGTNAVGKDEFLRAYNKNKTAVADKTMALREYLDLYIKFRLKVKAAKDLGIDTLSSLATDLRNFRTQVEETYLNDESEVNALIQEAANRARKDIHVAYLFFPFENTDTLGAFNTAWQLYKKRDSIVSWNDVGFITVFTLPYEFENIVYTLKPGEVHKPYRSRKGYYIFKNIEERKAVGKIKAAQILIAVPETAKEEDRMIAQRMADSVYKALLSGADFSEMAKQVSNDKMTYMTGGVMPEFGVGKFDPAFENKVFALQKDGDITPPFKTSFGYHIVKRISKTEVPRDKNDEAYQYSLKQQVLLDSRIVSAKEKFLTAILKKLNYKKNAAVKEKNLWKLTDSALVNKNITVTGLNNNTVLFSLNNRNVKVSDWISFAKNYPASSGSYGEADSAVFKKFISNVALENYKKRLPDFNPEFKYQLQEFKEGNMLFEVMQRKVWDKASNDSSGLRNYYVQHKTKYTWNESADIVLISCSNEQVAKEAAEQIRKDKSWKQVAEENISGIQTDSGRYELTQIPAKPNTKFIEGMVTEPLINENDGTATFVKIIKIYPANQQRDFEAARGLVINDYQNYLEEKWIEQLKKKYPVKVNEKVFRSLL